MSVDLDPIAPVTRAKPGAHVREEGDPSRRFPEHLPVLQRKHREEGEQRKGARHGNNNPEQQKKRHDSPTEKTDAQNDGSSQIDEYA